MDEISELEVQCAADSQDSVKDTTAPGMTVQGESNGTVCTESKDHAVINGHVEPGEPSQNGLTRVKEERPSTLPPSVDGPGDTNNNVQDTKAPVLDPGSSLLSSVPASSSRAPGSFSASGQAELRHDVSEGRLGVVKKEEEPVSPIPALVPVGDQAAYRRSGPSSDKGKLEELSSTKSDNSQPSVKSESGKEVARQSGQPSTQGGSSGANSDGKVPSGEKTLQLGSDSRVKQENDTVSVGIDNTASDGKEENREWSQSMSDDESVGAMNNLLDDINQIQDDLEGRMDDIEQQLTGEIPSSSFTVQYFELFGCVQSYFSTTSFQGKGLGNEVDSSNFSRCANRDLAPIKLDVTCTHAYQHTRITPGNARSSRFRLARANHAVVKNKTVHISQFISTW